MSRMCLACISLNSKGSAIRPARGRGRSSVARISAMIASITLMALSRPSTMWARVLGLVEPELGCGG